MKKKLILSGTEISSEELTKLVGTEGVVVVGFIEHSKASESYVVINYTFNSVSEECYLPYEYRRTDTHIKSVDELVAYIKKCLPLLLDKNICQFKGKALRESASVFGEKAVVTLPIFRKLLKICGKWVCNKDFKNSNSQRRIQEIKERGFTVATKRIGIKTYHALLPFEKMQASGYEVISGKTRKHIIQVLEGINAYSGSKAGKSVLPDHKFPEIRWDKNTADSNMELTDSAIKEKFQLVLEQINQAKREVCRECYQTGKRGKLNNINFYYSGNEDWPTGLPKKGKESEVGCVGCFWYDMKTWREKLNELIGKKR